MATTDGDYELGHEATELERLELQGRALAPATRTLLQAGGLREGMRVLDLGSGIGDVAFVAADLVGASGEVVGVDLSAAAVDAAIARAAERGLANVSFRVGDIQDPLDPGPLDAIIGRLVLMYVPDPAGVLRTHAEALRPDGLVIPMEFDLGSARSLPAAPLVERFLAWTREALERAGVATTLGTKLWQVVADAGLRPLGMMAVQPCFGPDDPDGPAILSAITRTLLPLIESTGVASADEVGIETLEARLREEQATRRAVFGHPPLISAWGAAR